MSTKELRALRPSLVLNNSLNFLFRIAILNTMYEVVSLKKQKRMTRPSIDTKNQARRKKNPIKGGINIYFINLSNSK
jgi:hypothetical protein